MNTLCLIECRNFAYYQQIEINDSLGQQNWAQNMYSTK